MRIALLVSSLFPALSLLADKVTPGNTGQLPAPKAELPTDLSQLSPITGLPDLLTFEDGSKVGNLADWGNRRTELVSPLLFYQYGRMPPRPDRVTVRVDRVREHESGLGTEEWMTLVIDSRKKLKMRILAYVPRTRGPHPVIIEEEGSLGGSRNAAMFMKKNYLFIEYARGDLAPDKRGNVGPAQRAYPEFDWAMLAVWAWGGMRVVDYLESRPDVDHDRIAITGHSRGGKAALLAGALDERIDLVVPCQSGAGGAGSSRILGPGAESIGMNDKPNWYHERILLFAEKEAHLPFDQHFLKALVAPRALLCLESSDDLFANPVGTHATSRAAMAVFQLHDRAHLNGLIYRRGGHSYSNEDWKSLLEFAEFVFYQRLPPEGRSFWQDPVTVEPEEPPPAKASFVTIGDPGNRPDEERPRVGSHGAVDYAFEIGSHRVSNAGYCSFLNAVARKEDPHGLHHPKMRIRRVRSETEQETFDHHPDPGTSHLAVTYVSWFDAARYCNWLHGGKTERGTYNFSDATKAIPRAKGARIFLPTEDEWYKAAYYGPGKKNYAHFRRGLGGIAPAFNSVLPGTKWKNSPYGMADIDHRTWDWTESRAGLLFRGIRSNSWFQGNNRQAAGRFYSNADLELGNLGFRVARALINPR